MGSCRKWGWIIGEIVESSWRHSGYVEVWVVTLEGWDHGWRDVKGYEDEHVGLR